MKKLNLLLTFLFFFLLSSFVSADYSWSQYATSSGRHSEDIFDYNLMSTPMSSGAYIDTCTITPSTKSHALIDSTYKFIWIVEDSALSVYDSNCILVDTIDYFGGVAWSSGAIWNADGDDFPEIYLVVNDTDGDMLLRAYEMDGNFTLNSVFVWTLESAVDCMGVQCVNDGSIDYCVAVCDNGVHRVNVDELNDKDIYDYNSDLSCDITYGNDPSSYVSTWASQIYNGFSKGDIDSDNKDEMLIWLTQRGANENEVEYFVYDPYINDALTNCEGWTSFTGYNAWTLSSPLGTCMLGQIGTPNSLMEILCSYSINGGSQTYKRMVINSFGGSELYASAGSGYSAKLSSWTTGDFDFDNSNEACVIQSNALVCVDDDYTLMMNCNLGDYYADSFGIGLTMVDYDLTDSYMELVTQYGIFQYNNATNCSRVYDFGLNDATEYQGQFLPVDITDDGLADLIYSDLSRTILYKTSYGSSSASTQSCNLAICNPPCIYRDTFSYSCNLESMNYNFLPAHPEIFTTSGKVCYNSSAEVTDMNKEIDATQFYNIVNSQFDMTISNVNNAHVTHVVNYLDATTSEVKPAYTLLFYSNNGTTYIGIETETEAYTLCSDCWTVDESQHYSITHFIYESEGMSFYNTTSNSLQGVEAGTFTLTIDSDSNNTYGNIPLYTAFNATHSIMIDSFAFTWYDTKLCLDNIYFQSQGATAGTGVSESPDLVQVGDYCNDGNDCLTGLCEYNYCALKVGGMTCEYGWQCISNSCINNKCSKESIEEGLEASAIQQFGKGSLNFVALFFIIGVPLLLIFASGGSMIGAGVGAFSFIAMTMFFTIIGWLNPLITLGVTILMIATALVGGVLRMGTE